MTSKILEYAAKQAGINKIGILAENDKMSLLPAAGKVLTRYRSGGKIMELSVQIQAKGSDQKLLIDTLSLAQKRITELRCRNSSFQILSVTEGQLPMPVIADEKGNFIYACGAVIKYFAAPPEQEDKNEA